MTSGSLLPGSTPPATDATADRHIVELPGGRSVAYRQHGSGPDCLLIHGTLMTLEDMWLGLGPTLSRRLRITIVDRPGHGLSRRQRLVDASPWRQARILRDFSAAIGLERPVVVGHSFGGTVALAYAMLGPETVRGIVALAPMCLPEMRLEAVLFGPRGAPGLGDYLAPLLGASVDPLLLPSLWRTMFLPQAMPTGFAEGFPFPLASRFGQMIAEGEDAASLIPALTRMATGYATCGVPTRILGGMPDVVVNNAAQGYVAAALMPNASFRWVGGIGHMLHHFAPSCVMEEASAFL